MNINIPFSKEIVFKSNIAEVTSISLEKDISINDNELLGDFILNGEYKNLDINVDTFPFNHVIPFSVNLDKDIDLNTLTYDIYDFNYEIIDNNILKVNITLHVEALKNIIKKEIDETIFDKLSLEESDLNIDELIINNNDNDNEKELTRIVDNNTVNVNSNNNSNNTINVEENISNNVLLNNSYDNDYITYHIHNVKLNDTIDSISSVYNINKDDILDINNIDSMEAGDKLIIPFNNINEK